VPAGAGHELRITEGWPKISDWADLTDADVVIQLVHDRRGRAGQVEAATRLQEALETTYTALAQSFGARLEQCRIVDEVPRRRTTIWLQVMMPGHSSGRLDGAADAAVLKYLARGTLALLAWLNAPDPRFADLRRTIRTLAEGTLPDQLNDAVAPATAGLVKAVTAWQGAKDALRDADSVRIITGRGAGELDVRRLFHDPESLVAANRLTSPATEIILIVERPDYDSTGCWQLRYGSSRITVPAESANLFDRYYRRDLDIRPGDGLRARAIFERLYGPDNELLSERVNLVEVLEVLPARAAAPEKSLPAQRHAEEPAREPKKPSEVIERIEGDFGTLTLREIPIH